VRVVAVVVSSIALVAGSASASTSAMTGATVRITGNGPLSIVGSGWKPFEALVVKTRIRGVTKTSRPHANQSGYWRIVVRTIPIGCERVVVTATGPRTGTRTARRMFGACQPLAP
jgi:hypothetical protein